MNQFSTRDGVVVGVDIGGTKIAAGLVNHGGEIISRTRVPMVANGEGATGLSAVISALIIVVQSADAVNRAASKFSHLALRLPRERRPSWPLIIPGGRPFLNGVMVRSI